MFIVNSHMVHIKISLQKTNLLVVTDTLWIEYIQYKSYSISAGFHNVLNLSIVEKELNELYEVSALFNLIHTSPII